MLLCPLINSSGMEHTVSAHEKIMFPDSNHTNSYSIQIRAPYTRRKHISQSRRRVGLAERLSAIGRRDLHSITGRRRQPVSLGDQARARNDAAVTDSRRKVKTQRSAVALFPTCLPAGNRRTRSGSVPASKRSANSPRRSRGAVPDCGKTG